MLYLAYRSCLINTPGKKTEWLQGLKPPFSMALDVAAEAATP